ncbi:IS1 family transposase [Pseudanabaena mucicola]|uniref:IS1 family transposase n=1 Tax=Pseudanabaena mucicola FACHB-723 TaxID=2692860 RepID=A0ABR8A1T5_9CYAN|nr:IS1 family transposase [Pseudanabaena mucicola]MBD2189511.1 IS1 family transposase [Pseudanabaena mucicola FACHB-723]
MNWKLLLVQKNKIWLWTAVDHFRKGILALTLGDHSAETFAPLWAIVGAWQVISMSLMVGLCILVLSLMMIQIISKTYMTRVEGENSRLRHYLARLHRKTFCYSKSLDMLRYSVRLLIHYLHDPSILSSL